MNGLNEIHDDIKVIQKDITSIKVSVARLETTVDGGPGNAVECVRHRTDIETIKSSLQRYAGGIAVICVSVPILIKIFWK